MPHCDQPGMPDAMISSRMTGPSSTRLRRAHCGTPANEGAEPGFARPRSRGARPDDAGASSLRASAGAASAVLGVINLVLLDPARHGDKFAALGPTA
eukprot:444671-Hanusia_phi.AAC.1